MSADMNVVMEIMSSLQGLQTKEKMEIKELHVVLGLQNDGVLLKVSSPNPDGVVLSRKLGDLFTKLPKIIKMQCPDINVVSETRDLTIKKGAD